MNLDDKNPVHLNDLLREAARAAATDVLLAPAPRVGKLIVRSAAHTLVSRIVDPAVLRTLSLQLGLQTGQPYLLGGDCTTMDASVASFELHVDGDSSGIRVRVICTPTPSGPMVRLRLQPRALLRDALEAFRDGRFGGEDVLDSLRQPRGVIFVAGPTSGGKTSALHHLAANLTDERVVAIVSEAEEFALRAGRHLRIDALRSPSEPAHDVLILDEMDETDKLEAALSEGRRCLVLATLVAPRLDAAVRRIRAASADVGMVLGVLRVDWHEAARSEGLAGVMRRPSYRWFPFEGQGVGQRAVPLAVLQNMDDFEAYRALEMLDA